MPPTRARDTDEFIERLGEYLVRLPAFIKELRAILDRSCGRPFPPPFSRN